MESEQTKTKKYNLKVKKKTIFCKISDNTKMKKHVSTGVGPSAEYRAPNFNFERLPNVEILCSNSHRKIIIPCEWSE